MDRVDQRRDAGRPVCISSKQVDAIRLSGDFDQAIEVSVARPGQGFEHLSDHHQRQARGRDWQGDREQGANDRVKLSSEV